MAEAELPHDREGLDGEGLVQFDQVEILHGEAGAREHLSSGRDGTDAHRPGLHARGRGGHDTDEGSEYKLVGLAIAREEHDRSALADPARVAGANRHAT